ncbi:hypothetical protein CYY_006782 [Polysphondylium violaceum]|uniref:Cytochrome P450 family protein n=1 Tax=Polysphondylium violaceum TaxID=133409 RepID=A0A8J4PQU4_9MYCE|nr:hypothetical protein CYY_006782 [Polysphondylium violaceum]
MLLTLTYLFLMFLLFDFICKNYKNFKNRKLNGPKIALPLIGNFNIIVKDGMPHYTLHKLSKVYGKVYRIWFGDMMTLVVSDPKVIREIFVKNFDNFINRPSGLWIRALTRNHSNLVFGRDDHWKNMKSLIGNLLSSTKLKQYNGVIDREVEGLLSTMNSIESSSQIFYPKKYFKTYTLNIILELVFSKRISSYDDCLADEQVQNILNYVDKVLTFSFGPHRFIESFGVIFYLFMKLTGKIPNASKFIDPVYQEHISTLDPKKPRDFLDELIISLGGGQTKEAIDSLLVLSSDFLITGTETSGSTLEWLFVYMANYPDIQEKVFGEIKSVVGSKNRVTLTDRASTPYFNAILKEVMRIKPIAVLGMPREALDDIQVGEYFIPKGTQVFPFNYGVLNDPDYWEHPNEFIPERFLANNHSEQFLPFGAGPRNCVGSSMALDEIYLLATNILLSFKLSSPNDQPIDDTELFRFVVQPKEYGLTLKKRI